MSDERSFTLSPANIRTEMRRERVFRYAWRHWRKKGYGTPERLIIGIGQMHAVGHGRFERFQAREIAKIQYWIFQACSWMSAHGIHVFGQEGLSSPTGDRLIGRLPPELLIELQLQIGERNGVRRYFRKIAQRWRKALKNEDAVEIRKTLQGLDALNVLQAIDDEAAVFAIEQRDVHSSLAEEIKELHKQIESVERKVAYKNVVAKKGKGLTEAEYDIAVVRHELVRHYNELLNDETREASILEEVLEHAEEHAVTVFVLGQGHRKSMLRRMKETMPSGTQFAWITPPLLWMPAFLGKAALLLFPVIIAVMLFFST